MTAQTQAQVRKFGLWIDGREHGGADDGLAVINPTTGVQWASIVDATADEVDLAVSSAAAAARGPWKDSPDVRASAMLRLADLIEEHAEALALLDVNDNGKLLRESVAQIANTHRWLRYFAGMTDKVEGSTVPASRPSALNLTLREPLGVIACITAWNSPVLQAVVKVAPALAAGNTVVIKPSELAATSTIEFGRLCTMAGIPDGVVNVITGRGEVAGSALVRHPEVAHVCFTGSPGVGRVVAAEAGRHLKGMTLELGGKSPNIIFDDAELDAAIAGVLGGIYAAGGQSCVAGSRLLVQRAVHDEVLERLKARAETIVIGPPDRAESEMGPIANRAQFEKIGRAVEAALEDGGRLVTGGEPARLDGLESDLYYTPTIVTEVDVDSRLAQEEVFGPVLAVFPFDTEEEAVALANSTSYGLAAGVWTRDLGRARRMVSALDSGAVFVNTYRVMAPNMPVGGFRSSGVGRENGIDAVQYFTRVKAVWLETDPPVADPFTMRF